MIFWITVGAIAQEKYILLDESTLVIEGTSTLHDWLVGAGSMEGSIVKNGDVNTVELIVPVAEIQGEKAAMDKKMHEALKRKSIPR